MKILCPHCNKAVKFKEHKTQFPDDVYLYRVTTCLECNKIARLRRVDEQLEIEKIQFANKEVV